MGYKKSIPGKKGKDERPKRSFAGKKSFGDKPAFKKRYNNDSSFSKDTDDKRPFRSGPSTFASRPDDRERKPFRRPESKFGDDRKKRDSRPAHSPRNPKWEGRPDWKKKNDEDPIAHRARVSRPDENDRSSFRKPGSKFGDDRRRDSPKPFSEGRERTHDERPERASRDNDGPGKPSRDSRPEDGERKPFRKLGAGERPTYKDFKKSEDDSITPAAASSPETNSDDRERKPFGRPENKFGSERRRSDSRSSYGDRDRKFGDDKRVPRPRFSKDSNAGEGEKKWNRKSDSEFYGDRRKSAPRERGFAKKSFNKPTAEDDGLTRLNKFISNAGICSRREADEMIEAGVVSVNGEVITQLGYKVKPEDVVKYNNEVLKSERMLYILLNKPKDFITTADDPEKRKTVMTLVANACKERVYPVGRLDRNTTGLLLLTNDGDLTRKLTHPSFEVQKIYQVELDQPFKHGDMETVEKGIHLEDGFVKVDAINYVGTGQDKSVVGVEIHSGRNRIVRRIFEHLGYEVKKLDRVYFAGITKKDLARGRWRFLTELEVASLKIMTGSKKFKNVAPEEPSEALE